MRLLILLPYLLLGPSIANGQAVWIIPERSGEILLDGLIEEWRSVEPLRLVPGGRDISAEGSFETDDVQLDLRAVWDKENLYLALEWRDNVWEIENIQRRDAVWVTADRKRRDRMLFFDNFKFHIRTAEYDYTFWTSPRVNEQGPFGWHRLLRGLSAMEAAIAAPMVSARQQEDRATLEIILPWKELRLKGKKGESFPLSLIVSDNDQPGRLLDYKLRFLKWLSWEGRVQLAGS